MGTRESKRGGWKLGEERIDDKWAEEKAREGVRMEEEGRKSLGRGQRGERMGGDERGTRKEGEERKDI